MTARKKRSSRSARAPQRKSNTKTRVSPEGRIRATIQKIPRGKVSTYGAIARAAGWPGRSRQVARVLQRSFGLPWQRVLGAGGEIKLRGDSGIEQRLRLEAEGVRFRGRRVDMKAHEFSFSSSEANTFQSFKLGNRTVTLILSTAVTYLSPFLVLSRNKTR